ncbi:hypothetical protein ACTL6P_04625 [Endozoicomonas acroporae]|uniref:hypothetical protein n=1 Tax=Endozoicomonas acroporae TaxID=1701104 RepID=UPI000C771870|nr:hypothetical protein [Endozoicomonas acroporae]
MAGLDYEEALLEGLSIVVDADDADDPSQQIYHRYTELCQPATIPPELEASLTTKEQNIVRVKNTLLIAIFSTLMFILANTTENLKRYRDHLQDS